MNIRGIDIHENSDVQDILSAFSVLNSEVEALKDDIAKLLEKFEERKSEVERSEARAREFVEALTALQLRYENLQEEYSAFFAQISTKTSKAISDIEKSLNEALRACESDLRRFFETLSHSFEAEAVEKLKKISERIDEQIEKSEEIANHATKQIEKIASIAKSRVQEANEAVRELREEVGSLSWKMLAGAVLVGMALGGVGLFYWLYSHGTIIVKKEVVKIDTTAKELQKVGLNIGRKNGYFYVYTNNREDVALDCNSKTCWIGVPER